ncbi:MAG: carboxypeptidase regulatory-like domain-containing protein [bacterium]|nr:carboxypeptidase regulatory-like domain-containing protein [bacterium]
MIWKHFLDNTESAPAISGDGKVVATADNSGFVQTWHFDSLTNEYFKLWQYRVPVGAFTNWASSVGISADGKTIVAGSLIFVDPANNVYDGTVICFDTYGDGLPKWVFAGGGDLVDDIKVSDDGKVATAVTWGDLAHTRPDLMVFDTQTGELTFNVVTPGSFFTCDLSPDGKRMFAGGKAVHAREMGSGGRIYLCEILLGGGTISGTVNLTNTGDDSGVLVKAVGTTRTAITDMSGNYILENVPAGTYTVHAEKPGYNFGSVANVVVTEGGTTSGVNMSLTPFTIQPPTLSASTNLTETILLSWSSLFRNLEREKEIALMVGDTERMDLLQSDTRSILQQENKINFISELPDAILADSIAIYRSLVSGGPYQRIARVPATETSYNDMDVFALRNYYYVINVFNETGQSIYSNEAMGKVSDSLLTFSLEVPEASIPNIDGVLSPGEWDDAFKLDISDIFGYGGGVPRPQGSAYLYLKFDDATDMLYVAGEDFLNPTLDDNEGFGLYIDDNNNNVFDGQPPFIREGNFWAYWHPGGADLRFREIPTYIITPLFDAEVEFSDVNGHLQGEFGIPMGFIEGYQLQVFGPDKIVGLGAFLIARQGTTPVYSGWWPQTMNTVFNPQYFGDVGIDVSLLAAPQPPSNISVTRQGQDLLITWDDPTLGINNDPLTVSPTINMYKNGEFITSFQTGVESYLDNDVYCVAWYEYQFEAYIISGSDTLNGPMTAPFGAYACQDPTLVPICYDDGEYDVFYVVDFTWYENKFGIRFTPTSYPAYVRKLETIVNGNDPFDFTINKDNSGIPGDIIAGPYRVFDTSPATVGTIIKNIPGIDPPEITQGDFWVLINWLEATPGAPGIGADADPPIDSRSMYYTNSGGWVQMTNVDIMVTAYVSDQPVGVEGDNEGTLPITFDLKQNYPNPFNPSTVISYQIPQSEFVTLEIYNSLGEKVKTLVNEIQENGYYQVQWDGKNNAGSQLSSGIYLYRLSAGNYVNVMKMVLLR